MGQQKTRCHISIVIENAGGLLGALVAIALSQSDNIIKNISKLNQLEGKSYFIGLGIFLLALITTLLFHLNRWYRTTIWLENGTLIVEQNTLKKKRNTYTIKNISNIDMEQNLFERVIGTYKIKIDTNSSALAKGTDIKIVFSKQKALEFKKEIMSNMGQIDDSILSDNENEDFDVVYSTKDIIYHCIYTANLFSILFLVGGFVGFYILMHYGVEHYTLKEFVKDAIGGFAAILITLVSSAYSLVKGFFRYYDFKVKRSGGRIYLTYGLFRKNMHTLPVDKINGIKLIQPFFSRIFGRYQVEVINVGTGDEKNESSNILLSCSKNEIKKYMDVLLPEFEAFIDKPIKRQSKKYFLHMIYGMGLVSIVIVCGFLGFNYMGEILPIWIEGLICLGILLLFIICSIAAYFAGGYYVGQEYLIIAKGIFTKTYVMIRYEKIQELQMNESLMSKFTKLKKSTIHILAALLSSTMALPLLDDKILEQISKKMIEAS